LKLKLDEPLSSFALKCSLRRYTKRRLIFVESDPQARSAFFNAARRAALVTAGLPPGG
jgi:hypothetical protein